MVTCEKKLKQIEIEIKTYNARQPPLMRKKTAWITIELIEKILNERYFYDKIGE
jgi:hypothetical protein